jgi:2-oxoisovalerate dehydrogenase E1 component subunit alpha
VASAMIRILDDEGRPLGNAPVAASKTELLEIHRVSALARALDDALLAHAGGEDLPWYVPALGEGCALVAATTALGFRDPIFTSGRAAPIALARGISPEQWCREVRGGAEASHLGREAPGFAGFVEADLMPASTLPGSAALAAVGAGLGRREGISVAVFGWGALASSAFAAALDAGMRWPSHTLLICVSSKARGAGEGADRAARAGWASSLVDGDDPIAVRSAVDAARSQVAGDARPELIELACSRQLRGANSAAQSKLGRFLRHEGALTDALAEEMRRDIDRLVEKALGDDASPAPLRESLFGELHLRAGAEELRLAEAFARFGGEYGGSHDPEAGFLV